MKKVLMLAVILSSFLILPNTFAANYNLTDLGAYNQPQDINLNDEIAGVASTNSSFDPISPFYWSPLSGFQQLSGGNREAVGINDSGAIVGQGFGNAVHWSNYTSSPSLLGGGGANRINNYGQITGWVSGDSLSSSAAINTGLSPDSPKRT